MRAPDAIIVSYPELCKVRISLLSAFSAATGFILFAREVRPEMVILMAGVFFLACGACALNQYQDRTIDALMPRTQERPIPWGRIEPFHALVFSMILIFLGGVALCLTGNILAPVLGLSALLWYNGLYAWLKRKTAFAAVPGAFVGSLPPAIGWVTAGGDLLDVRLLSVCFFFFMWQIPHFWLLVADLGEEYEKAGLPSLTGIFTKNQLMRIIFVWIAAAAVSCLFLAVHGLMQTSFIRLLVFAASLWLIGSAIRMLGNKTGNSLSAITFRNINIYMVLIMLLLSFDNLFL